MEWMTVKEAADLWEITIRRTQFLCEKDKVHGAQKLGNMWVIPKGTPKPIDGRTKAARKKKDKHIATGTQGTIDEKA